MRQPYFTWHVICNSGVLVQGATPDFLVAIFRARESRNEMAVNLPHSNLRIRLYSALRRRVNPEDIKAAVEGLKNPLLLAAVMQRSANGTFRPFIRRSVVEDAAPVAAGFDVAFDVDFAVDLAVAGDVDFSQAGEVAPPDGLTGGNSSSDSQDVFLFANGDWCYRHLRDEMGYRSDAFEVLPFGSAKWQQWNEMTETNPY
jgi:hypothetical protein